MWICGRCSIQKVSNLESTLENPVTQSSIFTKKRGTHIGGNAGHFFFLNSFTFLSQICRLYKWKNACAACVPVCKSITCEEYCELQICRLYRWKNACAARVPVCKWVTIGKCWTCCRASCEHAPGFFTTGAAHVHAARRSLIVARFKNFSNRCALSESGYAIINFSKKTKKKTVSAKRWMLAIFVFACFSRFWVKFVDCTNEKILVQPVYPSANR